MTPGGRNGGRIGRSGCVILLLAVTLASGAPSAGDVGADETAVVIAPLSIRLQGYSLVSQRQFEQALEDTPAHRESTQRMSAVLAGEASLFDARRLHGQRRIDFLEQTARRGDAAAATAIGDMLDRSDGVAEDSGRAFAYFRAGAIGGRMDAAHNLGAQYARGRGTRVDLTEALAWLIVAQARGDRSHAQAQLRQHLQDRGRTAAITAAEQRARVLGVKATTGEVIAALPPAAAICFDETRATGAGAGDDDVDASPAEADSAVPPVVVMTVLGERRAWPTITALQQAADRGEAAAMGALGRLLTNGRRLPPDPERAVVWLERSAALGDADAAHQLGDLYSNGEGVAVDERKAFTRYLQAARAGSPLSMASVGVAYTNGRGTDRDLAAGLAWLIVAKRAGVDLGQEARLRAFLTRYQPGEIAKAEAQSAILERELAPRTR